jgi:hypothetical protein
MVWSLFLDRESRKNVFAVRLGIAIFVLALVALTQSCQELKFSLSGVTTTAKVRMVHPSHRGENHQAVDFGFDDENGRPVTVAKHTMRIGEAGPLQPGDTFEVVYLKGRKDRAIPVSERSMFWPIVLAVLVGIGVVQCIRAYFLAQQGRL